MIFEIFVSYILTFKYTNVSFRLIEKGVWWMPWYQEMMKEAEDCLKPRGAVNQALIRGFPNGETHLGKPKISLSEYIG